MEDAEDCGFDHSRPLMALISKVFRSRKPFKPANPECRRQKTPALQRCTSQRVVAVAVRVGAMNLWAFVIKRHSWFVRLPIMLACVFPALNAQSAGQAGDWRQDGPGVAHRLDITNLPPPGATRSASQSPNVVSRPADALPKAPPGFTVQLWATGLDMPRELRTAPNGDIFLAESGAGAIRVWHVQPGAAHPSQIMTFASGLEGPFGMAFWPPERPRYLYVAETSRVVRYPYDGSGTAAGPAQIIVPHLPRGGHWTRDLAVAPDGASLFLSVGSASNIARGMDGDQAGAATAAEAGAASGRETGRAAVFRFPPQGDDKGDPLRLVASGLRNCVSLATEPKTRALWCVTNERDDLGDDLPPDYATHVTPGAFYGWPWYYLGNHEDPRHAGERPDLAARVTPPDVLIQAHSAPLGIVFYDGVQFPAEYRGDAFVTLHGSWNRARRTGYKIIRLRMRDGVATGEYDDFLTGFVLNDDSVWGRPVGLTVMQDGSLLLSEDGNGTVWRISH